MENKKILKYFVKFSGTMVLSVIVSTALAAPGGSSTFFDSEEIMPDKVAEAITENVRLSSDEIEFQKKTFLSFITRYGNNRFAGSTQYVFSPLNLDTRATVKYSKETDGTILFQLATNAGQGTNSDVTFPTQGAVYFEILSKEGVLKEYTTDDGQIISFIGAKNVLYIVETEKSFQIRKNIQAKYNRADKPSGRYLAIVNWDLFKQSI